MRALFFIGCASNSVCSRTQRSMNNIHSRNPFMSTDYLQIQKCMWIQKKGGELEHLNEQPAHDCIVNEWRHWKFHWNWYFEHDRVAKVYSWNSAELFRFEARFVYAWMSRVTFTRKSSKNQNAKKKKTKTKTSRYCWIIDFCGLQFAICISAYSFLRTAN